MNERVAHILKSPWTTHIGVGAIAFGGGVGLGYFLWGRQPKYEVVVPAEEPQLEFDFDTEGLAKSRNVIGMEEYVKVLAPETDAEVVDDMVIVRPVQIEKEESELIEVNVFENQDSDWDWEKEIESRNEEKPYILHRDEFYRNEHDYTQTSLTYYKGDDIMADEQGSAIFDHLRVTGPLRFGHGSGDPGTVLVRNNERRAEYEINLDDGRYEVEVLGLEYEDHEANQDLKHSRVSKFRME